MECARYSIHCNTYSTLFHLDPNTKSFLNKLDFPIHCSVPFSFLHSNQLCWTQEPLGRIWAMCLSFIMCTLTPMTSIWGKCFVQHFIASLFLNVNIYIYQNIYKYIKLNIYIYIKARENKSIKQILDLEWKVLNLILSSLKKLFQLKLGRELLSLVQPYARGGCWMHSHSCSLLSINTCLIILT